MKKATQMSPIPRHATPMLGKLLYNVQYSLKQKHIWVMPSLSVFIYLKCNLPFCHCRFREDPLVPRGVWRICQLKDSKAGDVGPMVMHLMWPNFRQFNSSKEAHRGKTCYSTPTYMLHMSETFQDKSFYENAHEISAQCCRLSVLVLKVNTRFWRKPFELMANIYSLLQGILSISVIKNWMIFLQLIPTRTKQLDAGCVEFVDCPFWTKLMLTDTLSQNT